MRPSANSSWVGSKIKGQNGYTGNGISQKLDGFFDNRRLPMYKDKPYSYVASSRKPVLHRRWQVVLGALLFFAGFFYWLGILPILGGKRRTFSVGKADVGRLMTGSQAVDWADRREKVKEAFMLSWDGYEKYAWGESKEAGEGDASNAQSRRLRQQKLRG